MQERTSGERHQAHGVAVQALDEVVDRQFRARKPIRLHIRRQHASRSVDGEDDVVAAPLHLFPMETGLRLGERDEQKCNRCREQTAFQAPAPGGHGARELRAEVRRDERGERLSLARIVSSPGPKRAEAGREPHRQPAGMGKDHGSLRNRVCSSPKPSPSNAIAG